MSACYEHFKMKMFLVQASYRPRTGLVQASYRPRTGAFYRRLEKRRRLRRLRRLFSPWRLKVSTALFQVGFSWFFMVFHGYRLVFMVFSKIYPPKLYPGPTIQSRSAARRAA